MTTTDEKITYTHRTQKTDEHAWTTNCEEYEKYGDHAGDVFERPQSIRFGTDWKHEPTPGFHVSGWNLTAKGMKQLAEFILVVLPDLERVEGEDARP